MALALPPDPSEVPAHDAPIAEVVADDVAPLRLSLVFRPSGTEARVPPDVTVFDAASWNGIAIDSTCGGHGTCRKCRVKVLAGTAPVTKLDSRAFHPDELRDGWRLACRINTYTDLEIEVPPMQTRPKAATVGVGRQVILRPAIQKRYLELEEPTLEDQVTDLERVLAGLEDLGARAELGVIRGIGRTLRSSDFKVTAVVVDDLLIAVEPGDTTARRFAIAFDLGTTTVVATLLDVATGTPVAVRSMLNLQQPFGADVITRISATMMDDTALDRLRGLAHETLGTLGREVCEAGEVSPDEVYEVAVAGNATMIQLALGIDPEPVGVAPFIMAAANYPPMNPAELGIGAHERAIATVFPALGAYVGGDIVAGMLASGLTRDKRLRLFIDVGTNCEIALGNRDRVLTTAAPAGPAFEAAQIRCGMRAADGAIEVVRLGKDELELGVIGGVPAVGVCGSGLVDAVAELHKGGLLDDSGRYATDEVARRIAPHLAERFGFVGNQERVFALAWKGEVGDFENAVYLSQRDVRELQFAKASIATGWKLLMDEMGVEVSDIQQVLLAGSFGSYLSPASAIRIGLVPKLPIVRIVSAGNVAGEGAKMALLSTSERHETRSIMEQVRYVELSSRTDFQDVFVGELGFPS